MQFPKMIKRNRKHAETTLSRRILEVLTEEVSLHIRVRFLWILRDIYDEILISNMSL